MHPHIARLTAPDGGEDDVLVLGDLALVSGGAGPHLGDGGLGAQLVARSAGLLPRGLGVQVRWDLHAALQQGVALASANRLQGFELVVVVLTTEEVRASEHLLAGLVAPRRIAPRAEPVVVVVVALHDARDSAQPVARLQETLHRAGAGRRSTVMVAPRNAAGTLQDPAHVAAMVLHAFRHLPEGAAAHGLDDAREVAVDRSLTALQGRTGHLRRALALAQNSFDVPYAQINLVSRGTLRSLAYIGRSSDGLRQSLSAEAVRSSDPLLVADTRATERFAHIPEVHGPGAIRYYVGHPLHDAHGHRIGVLCVLDVEPLPIEPGDAELIRDIAQLAEGELALLLARPADP